MPLRGYTMLTMMRDFRIAWLGGRPGGAKTALATRLGMEFIERGWCKYLVTNYPCAVATDFLRLPDCEDAFIVLDEGGVWLDDKQFDAVTAYVRKHNNYVVIASVLPANLRARTLNVQRVFDGFKFGLPLWFYACRLDYMNVKEKFTLAWQNPKEVFGLFDTQYSVADGDGIVEWIVDAFRREQLARKAGKADVPGNSWVRSAKVGYLERYYMAQRELGRAIELQDESKATKKANKVVRSGDGVRGVEELRGVAEQVYQASERISDAVPVLERASKRLRR